MIREFYQDHEGALYIRHDALPDTQKDRRLGSIKFAYCREIAESESSRFARCRLKKGGGIQIAHGRWPVVPAHPFHQSDSTSPNYRALASDVRDLAVQTQP